MEFVFILSMMTLILSVQDGSNNLSKKNIAPIKEAYVSERTKGYEYDSHGDGDTLFYYIFKNLNGFQILNTILWHYLYVEGPLTKSFIFLVEKKR